MFHSYHTFDWARDTRTSDHRERARLTLYIDWWQSSSKSVNCCVLELNVVTLTFMKYEKLPKCRNELSISECEPRFHLPGNGNQIDAPTEIIWYARQHFFIFWRYILYSACVEEQSDNNLWKHGNVCEKIRHKIMCRREDESRKCCPNRDEHHRHSFESVEGNILHTLVDTQLGIYECSHKSIIRR